MEQSPDLGERGDLSKISVVDRPPFRLDEDESATPPGPDPGEVGPQESIGGPNRDAPSHANVENTDADPSRCDGLAFEANTLSEPLERVQSLLGLNYELKVSTRDRPARTGADARIEGSGAKGEVRLALRPYGRTYKLRWR